MKNYLHFSIDDVIEAFKDLYIYNPKSIFEVSFFKTLLDLHNRYQLNVTIYVFEKTEGFNISCIPEEYAEELKKNNDWIQWGYHGITSGYHIVGLEEFIESFYNVSNIMKKITGKECSRILRLHYWEATKEQIEFLKKQGIKMLLTSDQEKQKSYILTDLQTWQLNNGQTVWINGIEYRKTDIRLDNIENDTDLNHIIEKLNKQRSIVFIHERYLYSKSEIISRLLERINGL